MKRFIIPVLLLGSAGVSAAQNLQLHYDFGKALYRSEDRSLEYRPQLTTTVEMFRPDRWGSTFFFVDMNYGSRPGDRGVLGAYWEIYRNLRFWEISRTRTISRLRPHGTYGSGRNASFSADSPTSGWKTGRGRLQVAAETTVRTSFSSPNRSCGIISIP